MDIGTSFGLGFPHRRFVSSHLTVPSLSSSGGPVLPRPNNPDTLPFWRTSIGMRSFFRIVTTVPATADDFSSNLVKRGPVPVRLQERLRALWDGISVHDTVEESRRQLREMPRLGCAIAELAVPDDAAVRIERTVPNNPGHHTLWADPNLLLSLVVAIHSREENPGDANV